MMLDPDDRDRVVDQFGVDMLQVNRDYLISVLLSFMSKYYSDRVLFFGGTALGRTHLIHGRLSEDLDLIALDDRRFLAADLTGSLSNAAPRAFGVLVWDPPLDQRSDSRPAIIRTANGIGISVRIQLLNGEGYPALPTERRVLHERYRGVAPATLTVPTRAAFAAWKAMAWHDRHAARDLWDLNALAEAGAIDESAVQLFVDHGPTGRPPSAWMFDSAPSPEQWRSQLAGQTRLQVGPDEALEHVRSAWASNSKRWFPVSGRVRWGAVRERGGLARWARPNSPSTIR